MKYEKLRIRNRDENNWVIEGYTSGGKVISRGKYAGQLTKGGYDTVNPLGYYQTLEHAAKRLMDYEIKLHTDVVDWDIVETIEKARDAVIVAVAEAAHAMEQ
jgi:hypothetical protein